MSANPQPTNPKRNIRHDLLACALLTLGTLIGFYHVLDCGFVNFDDDKYVTRNDYVQRGFDWETVDWAFSPTTKVSAHWHPLTLLSLALDYQIYGGNVRRLEQKLIDLIARAEESDPATKAAMVREVEDLAGQREKARADIAWGFHLTNLLLHLANTLLLFFVLRRSTGSVSRSVVVAGLFAWHPLHVESVAWVTERKDVLSTFFWMLAMLVYLQYVERPNWRPYCLMLCFFILGLLSKPMVVTLPCALLLWDFWPLRRWTGQGARRQGDKEILNRATLSWLVIEKIPLFLLAIASGVWTTHVMGEGTVRHMGETFTVGSRIANALLSYAVNMRKLVWPAIWRRTIRSSGLRSNGRCDQGGSVSAGVHGAGPVDGAQTAVRADGLATGTWAPCCW